jgi:MinD-like ATPase involved in chromosome partitioning or flagellar assembly
MRDPVRVLVAGGGPGLAEEARQCVPDSQPPVSVQWLRDTEVALARVGGGDVDVLVIDAAPTGAGGDHLRELLERLRETSPGTETIVVSESRDWTADLRRMVAARRRHADSSGARLVARRARKPKLIGFLGAKGGVGATTIALNTASVLAEKRAVVLAELGSGNDTLALRVRTTAKSAWPPGAALHGLWSVQGIPGLRLALAQDIRDPETLAAELEDMCAETDYLVLDLGAAVTQLVKCTLPRLDTLGVIVDLETLSVECARRISIPIGQPDLCPRGSIAVVVVNRASLACPFSVDEVQRVLGMPVLGTIPPAADLCSAAQRARRPVVTFEPESMAAQSLIQVAFSFAELT